MKSEAWHLLHPRWGGDRVTVARRKRGEGYVYIGNRLQEQLELEYKPYCYVRQKGSVLMLAFAEEKLSRKYYKVYRCHTVSLHHSVVSPYLEKGEKKYTVPHQEAGNLEIDLEELCED